MLNTSTTILELEYKGNDLIISKDVLEKTFGLRLGDKLELRPKLKLIPMQRSVTEINRIRALLDPLAGSWSDEDVQAFNTLRKDLWHTWKPIASV